MVDGPTIPNTVAVAPGAYPLGSQVYVFNSDMNTKYPEIVEDTGCEWKPPRKKKGYPDGAPKQNGIDVWISDKNKAKALGVQTREVMICHDTIES